MNLMASSSPRRIRPRPSSSPACGRGGNGGGRSSTAARAAAVIAVLLCGRSSSSSSSSFGDNFTPLFAIVPIADAFAAPPRRPRSSYSRLRDEGASSSSHSSSSSSSYYPPSSHPSPSHFEDGNNHRPSPRVVSRPLTREEEKSLLERMRTHPPHTPVSQSARQELLLHNLPLVRSIVTKVQRERMSASSSSHATSSTTSGGRGKVVGTSSSALTRDDLLHEGTIGLAEAIDRHDPKRDARLSTYATYWIRARIVRAVQCRGEHALLRFPERVVQASHRLARAAREMGLDWDDVVDMSIIVEDDYAGDRTRELKSRLCSRAGIPLAGNLFGDAVRVRSMSRSGYTTTPLESWMSSAASTHADAGDDVAMLDGSTTGVGQERHIVETLSKFLMPREVEVLSLRYGLVPPSSSEGGGDDNDDEEGEVEGEDVMRRPRFRDYEAEAEEGLFGPSGMLSHYAVTPNEDGIIDKDKLGVDTSVSASAAKLNGNGNRFSSVAAAAGATKIAAAVSAKSPSSSPMTSASRHAKETVMVTSPSSLPSTNSLLPFKEIGKRMKFSGEYCRRTCSVALNKLSRAVEEGRLVESDFLLGW